MIRKTRKKSKCPTSTNRYTPVVKKKAAAKKCGSPVLVEASAAVLGQVLGKDGLEGAQTLWRLDVADAADDDHGWRLHDRHRLDRLLLVELGAELVDVAHNVGHA